MLQCRRIRELDLSGIHFDRRAASSIARVWWLPYDQRALGWGCTMRGGLLCLCASILPSYTYKRCHVDITSKKLIATTLLFSQALPSSPLIKLVLNSCGLKEASLLEMLCMSRCSKRVEDFHKAS